ncbi:MAG: alginate export family protein, partial [Pseudomonadota bacterium]
IAAYKTESADLSIFGVLYAEWQRGSNERHDDDPESNSYGISLDIKSLPELFNLVNLHVQQIQNDEVYCAETTTDGGACDTSAGQASVLPQFSNLRYGAVIAGEFQALDFHLNYEAEQGTTRLDSLEGDINASMYQAELGLSFPETMNTRFYVLFHSDTGDNNGNVGGDGIADTSNDDLTRQRYDGFFYEQHRNAGLMDILAWGNLTYYSAGFTMEPMSDLFFGVHYHAFSRTTADDSVQFQGVNTGFNGVGNGSLLSGGYSAAADTEEELEIGQEIDVIITQKYDGGFALTGQAGVFLPGAHLKNAEATVDEPIEEAYSLLMIEGRMTF